MSGVFSHMTLMHDTACLHPARASERDKKGGEKMRKDDLVGNTLGKTANGSLDWERVRR